MARRRQANPFDLASGFGLASLHAGITLWHRWPMVAAACMQGGSSKDPEMSRMVSEKTTAMMKGVFDAQSEMLRLMTDAATGKLGPGDMAQFGTRIASAGMEPAFRTVRANSRRLSRRKPKI